MLVSHYDVPWLDSGWLRYFVLFARCEYGTEYIGKIKTTGLSDIKQEFQSNRYEYLVTRFVVLGTLLHRR